jgi:iron complex outermembrane recepter protein
MSELINARNGSRDFRWQLLTTVSAVALLAAVYGSSEAKAADQDADRPTIWIELGGQLEHVGGQGDPFTPGFVAANPNSPVLTSVSSLQAQNPPPFEFAEDGKISFQPESSDWVFSVGVNYGRSRNFRHVDHQTNKTFVTQSARSGVPYKHHNIHATEDFADTQVHRRESHAILDFSVGKDVGLGLFGKESSSVFSFGVRFAQFASTETFDIRARPDLHIKYFIYGTHDAPKYVNLPLPYFHTYHATGQASRSFHGIGPSLSWSGSAPVAGNPQNGEVIFDWGANAALLFGRQKARVRHQETAHYLSAYARFQGHAPTLFYQHPVAGHSGVRTVTVPDVGGFAGASYRIENFKVSLGYRADFFFGAMDGGIDAAHRENVGFYGPFATVSVGIGG